MELTVFLVLDLIALTYAASEPILLWTQRSHRWGKIRGITGPPDDWTTRDTARVYVFSETEEGFRYSLGYDQTRRNVYWSDRINKQILQQPLNATLNRTTDLIYTVFKDESSEIAATSVDWLTGNVYYTDSANGHVGVATRRPGLDNVYRILFSTKMTTPQGIAVDPHKGYLFWSDSTGQPKIERSSLAGESRMDLVTNNLGEPMGLTVDVLEERLYWVDRNKGTIESVGYDGEDRRTIRSGEAHNTFLGITLYKNYLFVTTENNLQVHVYRKDNGDLIRASDIDAVPYHIHMAQHNSDNPEHDCLTMGCNHLCLNKGNRQGMCSCKQGYYLELDGKTCTKSEPRYIYSIGHSVMRADVTIDDMAPQIINMEQRPLASHLERVQAIGSHYARELVYFGDTATDVIYRISADGGPLRKLTVQTKQVEGIGVDWLTSKVYWTDAHLGHIMVFQPDGRYHSILIEELDSPQALAVDSVNRALYWTRADQYPTIYKSNLDASNIEAFVVQDLMRPQGLVVDPRQSRLYWTDSSRQHIECISLDSKVRKQITAAPGQGLYDVTVFQEYSTWTEGGMDLQFGFIHSGETLHTEGALSNSHRHMYNKSYDVVTHDVYIQPATHTPCGEDNGDCQQHCYGMPDNTVNCGCAIGFKLARDRQTCQSELSGTFFLLYVDPYHKQVYQHSILDPASGPQGLTLPRMTFPTSMDFDQVDGRVYWIDKEKGAIIGANMDGSEPKWLREIPEDSMPERLVVDPASRHLFYTDSGLEAVYKMDIPGGENHMLLAQAEEPFALAVDYEQGLVYFTDGNDIKSVSRDGGEVTVVIPALNKPSALSMRPLEQKLYIAERGSGRISMFITNDTEETSHTVREIPGTELYSLAVGHVDIYFTVWNQKGVYSINRESGDNFTEVARPIYARLTDLKLFEEITPLPVVDTPPSMVIIIGAAIAAILFLILLVALLAALACRRRRKQPPGSPTSSDNFYEENNSADDVSYVNDMMNGIPPGNENGVLNHAGPPTPVPSPNSGNTDEYLYPTTEHAEPTVSSQDFTDAMAAKGIVITSGVKTIDKKKFKKRPQPPAPAAAPSGASPEDPGKSDFELTEDKKIGTVIMRLANRLRNRLSSVRFSGHGRPAIGDDPPPDDVVVDNDDNPPANDYVPAKKAEQNKRHVDIPKKPHKMPRGYAPASHNVPRQVRLTWGKAKSQKELHNNADQGNKFGTQI